jgi:NitT/TauT family transport system substrate-binding protein
VILAKADIADVPGLAGQRVAVATGSEGELLLRGAMAENQMAPSSVQIVSSHTTGPGALLASGAVAAAALTGAQAAAAVATDPTLHPLYTAGDHPGLISRVLVVRETTTDQRPGQILAFIRGWQALYMSNRDQADVVSADIAAVMHLDPTAVAADLAGLSLYDLAANAVELLPGGEYYDQTIDVIVAAEQAAGTITEVIKGQELIDGSFVQAVASAR